MRVFDSGRGIGLGDASGGSVVGDQHHCWCLNEANGGDAAQDLLADFAHNLSTVTGAPTITSTSSIGPVGRVFDGNDALSGTGDGADAGWTGAGYFAISIRARAGFANDKFVAGYAGAALPSIIFQLIVRSGYTIRCAWEDSGGSTVVTDFTTDFVITPERWTRLAVEFLDEGGGLSTVRLYADGGLVEELTGVTSPRTTDDNQRWILGADYDLGAGDRFLGDIDHAALWLGDLTGSVVDPVSWLRAAQLFDAETAVWHRVLVEDSNGDLQDMTDYFDEDWLTDFDRSRGQDDAAESLTVDFHKRVGEAAISPLNNNPANWYPLTGDGTVIGPDDTDYVPFFQTGATEIVVPKRRIVLQAARVPLWIRPQTRDWQTIFDGVIDAADWGDDADKLHVEARDKTSWLQDGWTEGTAEYGTDAGRAIEDVLQDIMDDAAAATPPNLPGDYAAGQPDELHVIGSPTWLVKKFAQEKAPIYGALAALAEMQGWGLQQMWDYIGAAFRITLYEPRRLPLQHHARIDLGSDVAKVTKARVDVADVRTGVSLTYLSDNETEAVPTIATGNTTAAVGTRATADGPLTIDGAVKWLATFVMDTEDFNSSEACFGALEAFGGPDKVVRRMFINEKATSAITDIAEAQAMGVALVRDTALPKAEYGFELLRPWPELEIGDYVSLGAHKLWFTSDQSGGIVNYRHSADGFSITTRGQPSGGSRRHLDKEGRPGTSNPPSDNARDNRGLLPFRKLYEGLNGLLRAGGAHANAGRNARIPPILLATFGKGEPPAGYRMAAGTWTTDADYDVTNGAAGRAALALLGSGNSVQVRADGFSPIRAVDVVEVEAKIIGLAATQNVQIDVVFYDKDFAVISTGTAINKNAATTWTRERGRVTAPSNARFFRVIFTRANANTNTVLFSEADAFVVRPSFRAYRSSNQTFAGSGKAEETVVFNNDSSAPDGYDIGAVYATGSGIFTAPEDGRYRVHARVQAEDCGDSAQIKIRKDTGAGFTDYALGPVQLTAAWQDDNGGGTGGTPFDLGGTYTNGEVWLEIELLDVMLSAGNRLDVRVLVDNATAGVSIIAAAGGGLSFFSVNLSNVE